MVGLLLGFSSSLIGSTGNGDRTCDHTVPAAAEIRVKWTVPMRPRARYLEAVIRALALVVFGPLKDVEAPADADEMREMITLAFSADIPERNNTRKLTFPERTFITDGANKLVREKTRIMQRPTEIHLLIIPSSQQQEGYAKWILNQRHRDYAPALFLAGSHFSRTPRDLTPLLSGGAVIGLGDIVDYPVWFDITNTLVLTRNKTLWLMGGLFQGAFTAQSELVMRGLFSRFLDDYTVRVNAALVEFAVGETLEQRIGVDGPRTVGQILEVLHYFQALHRAAQSYCREAKLEFVQQREEDTLNGVLKAAVIECPRSTRIRVEIMAGAARP